MTRCLRWSGTAGSPVLWSHRWAEVKETSGDLLLERPGASLRLSAGPVSPGSPMTMVRGVEPGPEGLGRRLHRRTSPGRRAVAFPPAGRRLEFALRSMLSAKADIAMGPAVTL